MRPLRGADSASQSPCVSRCSLGPGDLCLGCSRSLPEILAWSAMAPPLRDASRAKAQSRAAWSLVDGRTRAVMAIGALGEVGLRGGLPWRAPSELAWFKQATAGSVVAMGAKTWEGMRKALPGRALAVLSSREPAGLSATEGSSFWARDLDEAREFAFERGRNLCVVGGPGLWASAWSEIDVAWVSRVQRLDGQPFEADARFEPDFSEFELLADGPAGSDAGVSWSAQLMGRAG